MLLCQQDQCCPDGSPDPVKSRSALFFVPQLRFCRFTALRCTGAKALSICTSLSHREVPRCRCMVQWNLLHSMKHSAFCSWKNRRVQSHRPDNLLKISKSQMLGNISTFFIWLFICTLPVDWDSRCLKDKVHDCTGGLGLVTFGNSFSRKISFFWTQDTELEWFVVILL